MKAFHTSRHWNQSKFAPEVSHWTKPHCCSSWSQPKQFGHVGKSTYWGNLEKTTQARWDHFSSILFWWFNRINWIHPPSPTGVFLSPQKKKNVAKKIDPLLGAASCKHVGHVTSHYLRRWVHKTNRNQNHESPSMKTFVATCCDTWTTSQYLLSKSPYRKQYNFQAAPTVPQPPGSGHSSWHVSYTSRGRWCLGIPKVSYQAHPEV